MRFEIAHQPSYAIATAFLDPGENLQAEAGAMVSMDSSISIETKARSGVLKSELVIDLTGPGTFTTQSRSEDAFLSWLIPRLPTK